MKDLIIIGSGPAGLSAAIYAERAKMDVVVIEKEAFSGGQIINTEKVDNYLGLPGINGFELAMKYKEHADSQGVDIKKGNIIRLEDKGNSKLVLLEDGSKLEAKAIIVASGAKHRLLGAKGESEFAGAGVSYCATCDGAFFKNRAVAVVGGGYVALQDALYLAKLCSKVYLIHRRDEFRVSKGLTDKIFENDKIEFIPFSEVQEISGEPGDLSLKVYNNSAENYSELKVSGLFVAVGMQPVTEFLEGIVELDKSGYIVASEDCKTNVEGIFAAGDVRTKPLRQLVTAVADGATAIAGVEAYMNSLA